MSRTLTIAAIQMDAQPAPTMERLARAESLILAAARAGAQLVVLPELFNTGYGYLPSNYALAESLTGSTCTWMRRLAAQEHIHLAGSLLVRDPHDISNALLLVAPDGQQWRYNKHYPWGWERAYFRGGQDVVVADTTLGRIGLLVCWDAAHPTLWQQYAGQVQCMVISSCPPDVTNPIYTLPTREQLTLDDFGSVVAATKDSGKQVFASMINEQAAWLGVPVVNTVGTGCITTDIPRSRALLLSSALLAPKLLRYVWRASSMQMTCAMLAGCKVVDARGMTVAELPPFPKEAYTIAAVALADQPPQPQGVQPSSPLPASAYGISDVLLPRLARPLYEAALRGARRRRTR
jgi:predicted amidohydrolase